MGSYYLGTAHLASERPYFDEDEGDCIQLPHQCDAWEIGDADDARRMIADLLAAIARWEAKYGTVSN